MKEISVYLTFDGNGHEAMRFYEDCLGGELYSQSFGDVNPNEPEATKGRLMHARLTSGPGVIMASDSMPGHPWTQGNNFSVSIQCESNEEQDRLFAALGQGGNVTMPLADTFWGARFGMLKDRFGVGWMFNTEHKKSA